MPQWLARVDAEDQLLDQLADLATQARARRAQALADGVAQVGSNAAVGRLLTPQVTGQAVGSFISAHLPAPQDLTGDIRDTGTGPLADAETHAERTDVHHAHPQ
jgi:hypothetical protein